MNILIILNEERNEKITEVKYGLLLEHARCWVANDNEVYLFGIKVPDKWKDAGFHFVKSPGRIPSNIRAYFWFLSEAHPRVDLVIQSVGVLNFLYKKTATVLYWPDSHPIKRHLRIYYKVKEKLIKFICSSFFKKSFYLVSDWQQVEMLLGVHVDRDKIYLIKKGLPYELKKKKLRNKIFGKRLLFASKSLSFEGINLALEIFKNIDRRNEGWIFTMIIRNNLLGKIKTLFQKLQMQSKVNFWVYESPKTLIRELIRSDIFLDTLINKDSIYNDIIAMNLKNIVIAHEAQILEEYRGFDKVAKIALSRDPIQIAKITMDQVGEIEENEKHLKDGLFFSLQYFWDQLAEDSINFLGKIRPE